MGVGGSEVGAICGLNKWESGLSLWAKRSGVIPNERGESEPMEWGTLLEPVIIEKFKREHPELDVLYNPGTFIHSERRWQLANPDALARHRETGEIIVVEIKTARYEDDWDDATGAIPPSYRAQVLWYLQTFGLKRAIVATLFSGSRYREFEQTFDDFEADANLKLVSEWWESLSNGTQPDYDGAEATYEAVRAIHPEIDPDLPDVELGDLGVQYFLALADFEKAEENLRHLKSEVLGAMGKAKRATVYDEVRLVRQARGAGLPYLTVKKG